MSVGDPKECRGASCSCQAPMAWGANEHPWSRRRLIGGIAAGALAGSLLRPAAGRSEDRPGPEAALAALLDGNRRFVERRLSLLDKDLDILRRQTVEKQEPFASVLSCADSRVPVELLFDQSIGHVFVNRVAGNIATSEIIASIEYGVAVLGTRLLMVLGHSSCGAVSAAISAKAVPGQISALYRYIRPAVDQAGGDLAGAIRANAKIQAKLLRDSSPVIADALKGGTLKVVAAYFDLASGKVSLLD